MKTTFRTIIFCMLIFLSAGWWLNWPQEPVVAEAPHTHDHAMMCSATSLVDPAMATHTAIASGNWTDSATWQNGTLPTAGAKVYIPAGITVTVNDMISPDLKTIGVHGTLQFASAVNTELRVDTIVVTLTGHLEIGTVATPIDANVTAHILFVDDGPIDETWDPNKLSRGLVICGSTKMAGATKTAWTTLTEPPLAGTTQLQLTAAPTGWRVGDEVVVAATKGVTSDDKGVIAAIDGATITLQEPLEYDHTTLRADLDLHMANLTRNIQLESQNTATKRRGHVMVMHTLNADMRYVGMYELGRTDKTVPLDDWSFPDFDEGPHQYGAGTNIRGRYGLHFHLGGIDINGTPATVQGSVINGSPGWGFVNHSGYVDFSDNVSYNVVGAAFATEAGDELGSFRRNIALRTVNPNDPLHGEETEQDPDIREAEQDFGWQGDGFVIWGGGLTVEDNVVAGASGHAYLIWPEALLQPNLGFTTFPTANISEPTLRGLLGNLTEIDTTWVPLGPFDNNLGYNATIGLTTLYMHTPWFDDFNPEVSQAYLDQLNSTIQNSTLWGIETGLDLNYTDRLTVRNVRLIGSGQAGSSGIFAAHSQNNRGVNAHMHFENLTVEDFAIGFDTPKNATITINGGSYSNLVNLNISEVRNTGRQMTLSGDITLARSALFGAQEGSHIQMTPEFIIDTEENRSELLHFLLNDQITLNFGIFNNGRLYFNEQRADFVPVPEAGNEVPNEYVGQTNQQLQNQFGSSFGGALLPADAQTHPYISGGQLTASSILPTATVTATPTEEPTSTPTVIPSATEEPTSTPTVTPSATGEPTSTATVTPSPTGEPTSTPTVTPSPTGEPTSTPTVSATNLIYLPLVMRETMEASR